MLGIFPRLEPLYVGILNNCYNAISGLIDTLIPTVSLGMIASTLFGQTTFICTGFFTQLPPFGMAHILALKDIVMLQSTNAS